MPDAFGMGNLRVAYLHNLVHDCLAGDGDIDELRCEFRGLNLKGDVLTCHGTVTGERTVDGPMVFFTSESRWENQDGEVVKVGEMTTIYD
jgi:N-terminal half of MaoC dehydratase